MSDYLVGIDLGTSGIKAGVVDREGRLKAESYWDAGLSSEGPGRMAQSPDDFTMKALRIVADVLSKAGVAGGAVQGVALDGQMGGVVGIDRNFRPVTGLDMGLDIRSEAYNERMHRDHAGLIAGKTCGSPRNAPKMIWWKKERRDVYDRVRAFVTLGGYAAGRMAGLDADRAFIDRTSLAFFGNEDAAACDWSSELSGLLGIDEGKLPRVVDPWERIGGLTREAARESGLAEGTPVFAGAGDQPAGFLGAGLTEPGELVDVSGSSTILALCVEEFRPDLEHRAVMYMPSVLKGSYHVFTYINGGGISLRWFGEELLSGARPEASASELYEEMTEKAAALPAGSEGLLFIPYFGGRQCPYEARYRGGWLGLNWGHRREHLFRSMLESLAYDYLTGLLNMRKLFPHLRITEVFATGGGARNRLWNGIKADVLGLPCRALGNRQFALRGSALIAGFGLGLIGDLEAAARRRDDPSGEEEVYLPDGERHNRYSGYAAMYRELIDGTLEEVFRRIFAENKA